MFLSKKLHFLFPLICLFFTNISFAKKILLFSENGSPVEDYLDHLEAKNLKDGDELYVSKDKYFIYKSTLGEGNTTRVLEVINPINNRNYALRLPMIRTTNFFETLNDLTPYINKTINGYKLLASQNISIPKIIDYEKNKYILVEKIEDFEVNDFKFDFGTFAIEPEKIPARQLLEAEESLTAFAREVAGFSKIGDFHPGQLVYNPIKKKWILLDWSQTHHLAKDSNSASPFKKDIFEQIYRVTGDEYRLRKIERNLEKAIMAERQKIIPAEDILTKSLFKLIDESKKASDYVELYEMRGKRYTQHSQDLLFKHFISNQKKFKSFEYEINDLIRLGNTLTESESDFLKFLNIAVKKVTKIDDLIYLTSSYGHFSDSKLRGKLAKLASDRLKQLTFSLATPIPHTYVTKLMLESGIFSPSDASLVNQFIENGGASKRGLLHCVLSKLIK